MTEFNELIEKIEKSKKNVFSCLIYQNEELLLEKYFNDKSEKSSDCVYSASKSISSILMGIAFERCPQYSLDTPIQQLLPEYRPLLESDDRKWNTTIGHCLSQTTPFRWLETGRTWGEGHSGWEMEKSADWVEYLLSQPAVSKPGKRFCYNTGVSHLLPILIERMVRQPAEKFFEEALAKPLGFESYRW
jgi:CubicO group peptidase (beta-lactamase class C family)